MSDHCPKCGAVVRGDPRIRAPRLCRLCQARADVAHLTKPRGEWLRCYNEDCQRSYQSDGPAYKAVCPHCGASHRGGVAQERRRGET